MPPGWKFPVRREAFDYVTPLFPALFGFDDTIMRRGAHFLYVVGD